MLCQDGREPRRRKDSGKETGAQPCDLSEAPRRELKGACPCVSRRAGYRGPIRDYYLFGLRCQSKMRPRAERDKGDIAILSAREIFWSTRHDKEVQVIQQNSNPWILYPITDSPSPAASRFEISFMMRPLFFRISPASR